MTLFKSAPCSEASNIIQYVEDRLNGRSVPKPSADYPIHQRMLNHFLRLLGSEEKLSGGVKKMLGVVPALSDFDVRMRHSSEKLIAFAAEMAALSESNLAIVQQITASMNEVNSTIRNTSETMAQLAQSSQSLIIKNDESMSQLQEIQLLKEDVIQDTTQMGSQIEQLVEMAERVNDIVNGVAAIAEQTNLLALNASIEAARAGESGRGFAVVATEIRKLADNTKLSLNDMRGFVKNIQEAARGSRGSLNNTLQSTSKMNERLDAVSGTINQNVSMLKTTVKDVDTINVAMQNVEESARQVNQAMTVSAQDAEKLHSMTRVIHADAMQSADNAKQISQIDADLSDISREMVTALTGGLHAVSNAELIESLQKARVAHGNWVKNLRKIADEMVIYPLQTDSRRCVFGHFYHSVHVEHPEVAPTWNSIDGVHHDLHKLGEEVFAAVKAKDRQLADRLCQQAEQLSVRIMGYIDQTVEVLEKLNKKGVEALKG